MPSVAATSVYNEARSVYLNDSSATLFTNTVLDPFLKSAYEHFRNECALNGISEGYRIASPQTIAIGAVTYGTLPTDLLAPLYMEERTTGSTDLYVPMTEVRFLPQQDQSVRLNYWNWFDTNINFIGATQSNQVRLTYYWDFTPDAVDSTTLDLRANGRSFLAAKISAMVHKWINQNDGLASDCNAVAEEQLKKIVGIMIRGRQNLATRQIPFGNRRGTTPW
jgi:hypothetical protein